MFLCFQSANEWSMALPSEPQQNGAPVTPQLETTPKGQDDNR